MCSKLSSVSCFQTSSSLNLTSMSTLTGRALPPGRGRAGLTPRLSPAPAALWREGAPSSPGHQRRRSEERDRRRRPRAQGHHGISSLTDPSAAAVRPARVPAPAGPVRPLLPPQSARPLVPRAPLPRAEDHEVVTGPRMTPRHHCEAYSSAGEEEEEEEEEKKNVSPSQRDEVIQWLAKLKYQFNLYPETFALASSLLDRFLATVKKIPALKVLARDSFCGCSSSEILRMERIILDKLNWDLHTATPLDFLHIMDSSQLIHCRELAAHHLSALQSSLPLNSVYVYRPLKHTLVSCDRGALKLHPSSVSGPGFSKDNSKPEVPVRGTTAFYHHLPAASGCKHTSAKRKVEEMEVDDFYDGIKRLYNEDNASENVGSVCGTDLSRQEGHASPCPPLQPVSVM
ncbi:Cyclin-I [Microtus ochrogaster]|uniref:Cyclin-I n=1 Tax=Microtus ochrogaster TaxID=79684 RepID=A0A8J6KXY0_MICOH|nr:Cyclin-I [Microtus ochrogaster]